MKADVIAASEFLAYEYLYQLEALALEIVGAMDAIGANALPAFEKSVSKQQEICTRIDSLAVRLGVKDGIGQGEARRRLIDCADLDLPRRIRFAVLSLQGANRQYLFLLRHSGDSVRLLVGLCRSYAGDFQRSTANGASRAAWSCEL